MMDKKESVINSYITALDELNILMTASFYTAEGSAAERSKQVADDLLSILIKGYTLGVSSASAMLDTVLEPDVDEMEEAIFVLIDGKTFEDRVGEHVRNNHFGRLQTLAESEFHRVYNRAVDDSAEKCASQGNLVTKIWCTKLDNKVRDTHDYLEGVSVPYGRDFFTYDGDHAACPGGFTRVENNANCRCIVLLHKEGKGG